MNEPPPSQVPPVCVTITDFLTPEHRAALIDFALTHEADWLRYHPTKIGVSARA